MRFGLLGLLQVDDEAGCVRPVPGTRQRVLLAALLVHANRVVPAQQLAEIVWGGTPPAAAAALRNQVLRLRRALGADAAARITARDPGYLITVSAEELDVTLFESLHREARAAIQAGQWDEAACILEQALALWRGAALLDVDSAILHDEYGERLEQLRVQALEWQADAGLSLGRHAQLVLQLSDLTRQHPLREHLHAQLMLALYRCGRHAEALQAYQCARDVLRDELGADPGTELRALHQKMLNADPELASPELGRPAPGRGGPRQLPALVRHFVGRDKELAMLADLLPGGAGTPGTVVISAINGTAGIGKTTLAVYWAHQVAAEFPDGQLYVNLRGFDSASKPVQAAEAIRDLLSALGVAAGQIPQTLAGRAALYRSLLADKRVLVLLDNAHDAAQVRPMLPAAPGSLVLVTSRNRLASLAAAEEAHLVTLGVLTEQEARELLVKRLGPGRVSGEPEAAAELARLCAGLPLALAIVAGRAAARPLLQLSAIAAELSQTRLRLDALRADDTLSVRAVFSWSYQQLSEGTAQLFRLLGLHPALTITTEAAASLAQIAPDQARRSLDGLSAVGLISPLAADRYVLHDLVRAYAAELALSLEKEELRRAAIHRLLDHYLHTARGCALLIRPSRGPVTPPPLQPGVTLALVTDQEQALAWFDAERHHLISATNLAAASRFDIHAWQLPWAIAEYLDRQGHWHDYAAIQRTALAAAARLGDTAGQVIASHLLGTACSLLGDYDLARTHLTSCLGLCREAGDQAGEARAHGALCWMAEHQGNPTEALSHAEQALALFQALADRPGQADALNSVGWCRAQLGRYQQARTACGRALALHRELGSRHGEAAALDSLGYINHELGRLTAAIHCFERALSLFRHLGDQYHQANTLKHLGDSCHAIGDRQRSRDAWQQALSLLDQLHHPASAQLRQKLRADGPAD